MSEYAHPALQLFAELLAFPSPSSMEQRLAAHLVRKLEGWGYAPQQDGAGNVWVRLAGRDAGGPLVCYAAHTDEIGLAVHAIEADGRLRVGRSGGLFPWKLGEAPVEILGDKATVTGVLSMGAGHSAGSRAIEWADVRVITGLSPAQLAEAGVRPGSLGVPLRSHCGPVIFGDPADPLVGAWTFDDRMGVVTLLRLLETLARRRRAARLPDDCGLHRAGRGRRAWCARAGPARAAGRLRRHRRLPDHAGRAAGDRQPAGHLDA